MQMFVYLQMYNFEVVKGSISFETKYIVAILYNFTTPDEAIGPCLHLTLKRELLDFNLYLVSNCPFEKKKHLSVWSVPIIHVHIQSVTQLLPLTLWAIHCIVMPTKKKQAMII